MGKLVVLRHGETEWSKARRHTGRTDLELTEHGEDQARALVPLVAKFDLVAAFVSPAVRARRTAELAGVASPSVTEDLWEWDYGIYEGRTTAEISEDVPGWSVWTTRNGLGETADEAGNRVDRVIASAVPLLEQGDVALVAHGHILRILTARWLELSAGHGRLFALDTGTVSTLGFEHGRHVISSWNVPPA